jgi:ketopantoate reductase
MSKSHPEPVRIAIIGAGNVGATTAYALLLSGLAAETRHYGISEVCLSLPTKVNRTREQTIFCTFH